MVPFRDMPPVPNVEHRLVDIGRLRLHVAEAGDGEPVVMLHGWPQHWYMWRHVIPRLADRHRLLAVDLRGFGWSDAPPDGYMKESLANDVMRLLVALDLDRPFLVGHDWGALVGFLLCLRHPTLVARFLALNMIHPWTRPTMRVALGLWRLPHQLLLVSPVGEWALRQVPAFPRLMLWGGVRDRSCWTPEELATFTRRLQEPERARASVQLYRTWVRREFLPLLRGRYRTQRLRTPTLLVFGREDPAIRPHSLRWFESHADDMAVELIPGAGHFIADERPDIVADRALRFFAGEPAEQIALGPSIGPADHQPATQASDITPS